MNWDRKEKNIARQMVIDAAPKKVKCVLGLPSNDCLDVRLGFEEKVYTKKTYLLAVEEDKSCIPAMKRYLSNKFEKFDIFHGTMSDLDLSKYPISPGQIDFSFLDFCGNLEPQLALWLNQNAHYFSDTAQVSFTFKAINRKKDFEKAIIKRTSKEQIDSFDKLLSECKNNLSYGIMNYEINPNKLLQKYDLGRKQIHITNICHKTNVQTSVRSNCIFMMRALVGKSLDFERIYIYKDKDHGLMSLITINMSKGDCSPEDIHDIFREYDRNQKNRSRRLMFFKEKPKKVRRLKKTVREYSKKPVTFKTAHDIARHMGIYGEVESIEELSTAKQSWIKINSKRAGLNPCDVKVRIEKRLSKYGLKA